MLLFDEVVTEIECQDDVHSEDEWLVIRGLKVIYMYFFMIWIIVTFC